MPRTSMPLHRTSRRRTTATLRAGALGAALLAGLAACSDAPSAPGREPVAPRLAIQDGAHNAGNDKFYWLAPLVKDPVTAGTFDPGLQPVVQVCEVTAEGCGAIVAEFSRERGTGSEVVKVDHAAQRYFVNWHTGQCRTGACALDPTKTYRVRVLLGGLEAGHADVDVVTSQAQAKNVNTGDFIPLVDGKVLQVRFRIEEGIALESPTLAGLRERFRPLSERYSDAGMKPATGRSGSAALTVRALLNKDGTTDVEVASGSLSAPGALDPLTGTGTLEHVQLKALSSAGEAMWTRNFTGLEAGGTFSLHAGAGTFAQHMPFQVQANVKDIDPSRTDVVTVQGTVGRRPDLAVQDLQHPAQVRVDERVTIGATIRELNGDVGAGAQCVLYVDGVKADQVGSVAEPMWVDAGDVVNCVLATTFTTAGTKAIRVALEGVTPADDDPSAASNEATGSIAVTTGTDFFFWAQAFETELERAGSSKYEYSVTGVPGGELLYENSYSYDRIAHTERSQQHSMNGQGAFGLTFPLTKVHLTASSDGTTLQEFTLADVQPTWFWSTTTSDGRTYSEACTFQRSTGDGGDGELSVCSWGWTNPATGESDLITSFSYHRWAGSAKYYSENAYRYFHKHYGYDDKGRWTESSSRTAGKTPLPLGATYRIGVTITDTPTGAAPRVFVAETDPAIELSGKYSSTWDYTAAPQCYGYKYDVIWWGEPAVEGYSSCDATKGSVKQRYGSTTGQPAVVP